MKLRTTLLAATLLAPMTAQAQPVSGVYVGLGAGVNFLQGERTQFSDPAGSLVAPGETRLRFDPGFRVLPSVGYGLGNGLRLEVEGDYFRNSLSSIGQPSINTAFSRAANLPLSARGTEEKYGGFVNALFDINPTLFGSASLPFGITPYVGAGIGYLQSRNQDLHITSPGQFSISSTGSDGSFAYQGIVGLALPIEAVPGLALTAEYRFTGVAANRVSQAEFQASGVVGHDQIIERDNLNHSILAVAVRYAFNYPPLASPVPVAPPVSPAQVLRTYLVFFDWDRSDLTDRARQIVAEAAASATRVRTTRIEVQGNADSSGTSTYNQGLSLRRAHAVESELIIRGVPQAEIAVESFGDARPMVPTKSGVREPQNRGVEIILR